MTSWTIRRRVILSMAVILALMAVMAGIAMDRLARIGQQADVLERDSIVGLAASAAMSSLLLREHILVLEHVVSTDPIEMKAIDDERAGALVELKKALEAYERTIVRAEDRALFEAIRRAMLPFREVQAKVLALSRELKNDQALLLASTQLDVRFDEVDRATEALSKDNERVALAAAHQASEAVASARTGVVLSGALAVLLALGLGYSLMRSITEPLAQLIGAVDVMRTGDFSRRLTLTRRDELAALADGFNRMSDELASLVGQIQKSGIQVNTSVTEIAATSQQQQATATEIAATTTEIGATSQEITATSRELLRTMTEVARVAEQSAALAGQGQSGLTQMEETIRRVMDATGSINGKLVVLNEKAGNIGQVVTTITKVADQTNLLSLNAAIEAEKAGEYGRGFAVVASEIRRLADQTAVSSYDIEQMVKDIQTAVSAGVMGMDRFSEEVRRGLREVQDVGSQLTQIIQQVQALAPRYEAVNEGMQAQATGAEQITQALSQLSEAAQQTVDSLRQSNIAIGELHHVSSSLRQGISRFTLQG